MENLQSLHNFPESFHISNSVRLLAMKIVHPASKTPESHASTPRHRCCDTETVDRRTMTHIGSADFAVEHILHPGAYILREFVPKELSDAAFVHLDSLPRDERTDRPEIVEEYMERTPDQRLDAQKKSGGFTFDVYPFLKQTSARQVAAFTIPGSTGRDVYRYGGQARGAITLSPENPHHVAIQYILEQCPDLAADFTLVNLYNSASDALSHHSDKEDDLMPGQPIVCLSLGASRTFEFKPAKTKKRKRCSDAETKTVPPEPLADKFGRIRVVLHHGDVLVMYGNTQQRYTHGIPRPTKRNGVVCKPAVIAVPGGDTIVTEKRYSSTLRKMRTKQ